ncbi:MAG: dephospho-CoA kinase, partial [Endozoicomonadaceae bacterium]|nr:dephospho-CoA kinase [Endozoicomonadaceae bacterium]
NIMNIQVFCEISPSDSSGSQALTAIEKHFGHNVIQNDGTLNRKYLRHIIFNDLAEKKWLEDLLHPLIGQQIVVKLQQITTPYAILVSPLLLETTQSSLVNRVLVIDTPEEAQIKRAASRDNETEEHIKAIIKTQLSPADRLKKADDTVINNGSLQALYEKLDILHSSYLIMAAKQDNNIAKKQ